MVILSIFSYLKMPNAKVDSISSYSCCEWCSGNATIGLWAKVHREEIISVQRYALHLLGLVDIGFMEQIQLSTHRLHGSIWSFAVPFLCFYLCIYCISSRTTSNRYRRSVGQFWAVWQMSGFHGGDLRGVNHVLFHNHGIPLL